MSARKWELAEALSGPPTAPLFHVEVPIADLIREMAAHPDILALAEPARGRWPAMSVMDIYRAWHTHPKLGNQVQLYPDGPPRHLASRRVRVWRSVSAFAGRALRVVRWVLAGLLVGYMLLLFVAAIAEAGHPRAAYAVLFGLLGASFTLTVVLAWCRWGGDPAA